MPDYRLMPALSTHKGMRRRSNQDAVNLHYPDDPAVLTHYGALFIVADGVGGLEAGEKASRTAVDRLIHHYYADTTAAPVDDRLIRAMRQVNAEIYTLPEDAATTLTAAVIREGTLTVAWVGDSLAYHISGDQITPLVEANVLDDGGDVQKQGQLTRAIGHKAEVQVDTMQTQVQPGDRVLLCSDGLTRYLKPERLRNLANMDNVRSAVLRMIGEANDKGGADNVSAVLVRVGDELSHDDLKQHVARLNAFVAGANEPAMVQPTMTKPATRFPDAPMIDPAPVDNEDYVPINTKPASQFPDAPVIPVPQRTPSNPAAASRLPAQPSDARNWLPFVVVGVIILIGVVLLLASALTSGDTNTAPTDAPQATFQPTQPTDADASNAQPPTAAGIVGGEINQGDSLRFEESVVTYQRVGASAGDVAAFPALPDQLYRVEEVYTANDDLAWYRIRAVDDESNNGGWLSEPMLPAYRVIPAADEPQSTSNARSTETGVV